MKRNFIISVVLLLTSNYSFSQHSLEIEITEIRNNKGKIMLQLFDENEKVVTQDMSIIKENKCALSLKNLKPGKYGIQYFHDENLNGKMDTNFIGMPTEGFGFSNNAKGRFGPPPFEKWLFDLDTEKKIILIPTYLK